MERNKKILVAVIARTPYPLNSGGRIATYDALISLSNQYLIKLYIIDDHNVDENTLKHLNKTFYSVTIFKKNKIKSLIDSFRFMFRLKPLQIGYFYSKKFKTIIEKNNNLKKDYFISFVLRTAIYGENFKSKKFMYSIDSMYLNYKNSIKKTTNPIWKLLYIIESSLLKNFEKSVVKKFDKITYVNPNEASFWSKYGNVKCIPHGFDNTYLFSDVNVKKYSNKIVFIGRMDYRPNIEAIKWFVENVMNYLNKDIELLIIGGFASEKLKNNLKSFNIKFLGYVDNPDKIIINSICSIAPMVTGGGLQTKIIKSLSLGSIIVISDLASKPLINFKNFKTGYVANSSKDYIDIINSIYTNPKKHNHIKKEAYSYFLNNYENSRISDSLNNFFK